MWQQELGEHFGIAPEINDLLLERSFWMLEGKNVETFPVPYTGKKLYEVLLDNDLNGNKLKIETNDELMIRANEFLTELFETVKEWDNILVVWHNAMMVALFSALQKKEFDFRKFHNASLTTFSVDTDSGDVELLKDNSIEHLTI